MDIQLLSKRVPNMDVIIPTDDEAMVMNEGKTNLKGHAYDHFNFLQFNTGASTGCFVNSLALPYKTYLF